MSATGAWAFVHASSTVPVASLFTSVAVTLDRGQTWNVATIRTNVEKGIGDRPWIVFAGETLVMSWMPLQGQPGAIQVVRSTDHGASWSEPQDAIPFDPERPTATHGRMVVDADGTIRLPVARALAAGFRGPTNVDVALSFAVSRDQGASWVEEGLQIRSSMYWPPTAVGQTGHGTLFWCYVTGPDSPSERERYMAWCAESVDGGQTWSSPYEIGERIDHRVGWIDGRPDNSVDLVTPVFGAAYNETRNQLVVCRLRPSEDGAANQTCVWAMPSQQSEYATIGHDASGKAYVTAAGNLGQDPNPGQLYFVREI